MGASPKQGTRVIAGVGDADTLGPWLRDAVDDSITAELCDDTTTLLRVLHERVVALVVVDEQHVDAPAAELVTLVRRSEPDVPFVFLVHDDAHMSPELLAAGGAWRLRRDRAGSDYRPALKGLIEVSDKARGLRSRLSTTVAWMQKTSQSLDEVMHELRTPVNVIQGYTCNLLDEISGPIPPAAREDLVRIQDASNLMASVLGQKASEKLSTADAPSAEKLLKDTRVDGRRQVRLTEVAREVMSLFQQRADEAGVSLVVDAAEDTPLVWANRARIVQLVTNLVGNALRYTPKNGEIAVGLRPASMGEALRRPGCELSVRDTGVGIRPEHLARVFDAGWSTETRRRRSGLGLALCREIAEEHGTTISCTSAMGEGTAFVTVLPVNLRSRRKPGLVLVLDSDDQAKEFVAEFSQSRDVPLQIVHAKSNESLVEQVSGAEMALVVMPSIPVGAEWLCANEVRGDEED